jgi:hypothetical protein
MLANRRQPDRCLRPVARDRSLCRCQRERVPIANRLEQRVFDLRLFLLPPAKRCADPREHHQARAPLRTIFIVAVLAGPCATLYSKGRATLNGSAG